MAQTFCYVQHFKRKGRVVCWILAFQQRYTLKKVLSWDYLGIFRNGEGGCLPKSQNLEFIFCSNQFCLEQSFSWLILKLKWIHIICWPTHATSTNLFCSFEDPFALSWTQIFKQGLLLTWVCSNMFRDSQLTVSCMSYITTSATLEQLTQCTKLTQQTNQCSWNEKPLLI